jgi:hypothetical protein
MYMSDEQKIRRMNFMADMLRDNTTLRTIVFSPEKCDDHVLRKQIRLRLILNKHRRRFLVFEEVRGELRKKVEALDLFARTPISWGDCYRPTPMPPFRSGKEKGKEGEKRGKGNRLVVESCDAPAATLTNNRDQSLVHLSTPFTSLLFSYVLVEPLTTSSSRSCRQQHQYQLW